VTTVDGEDTVTTVDIRLAGPDDVSAVEAVVHDAFVGYIDRIGVIPAPMTADYLAAVGAGRVWVAVDPAGTVVGVAVLVPDDDHLLLDTIAVAPGRRRSGVGRRLLELADERARAAGLPEVRLYTHELMAENIAYYPRHGYVETHRAAEHGFQRVFFTRRLPG
jgi:ribosomal protein S18 acetylase RimI-like enzyme